MSSWSCSACLFSEVGDKDYEVQEVGRVTKKKHTNACLMEGLAQNSMDLSM